MSTSRRISISDPLHHTASGDGHCVATWRDDGSVVVEGDCPDEAGGCPVSEIEECLVGEADHPVGQIVRCDTTEGSWSVTLGASL